MARLGPAVRRPATAADLGRGHDHPTIAATSHAGAPDTVYVISTRAVRSPSGMLDGVFVGRSSDGGRSFPDTVTHEITNLNCNANMGVTLSDGSLVVVTTDHMRLVDGTYMMGRGWLDRSRTWAIQTKDGDEWSDPVRVAGGTDTLMHRTTAIAVNDSGVVAVGWYEKVAGAAPDCHRVMVAASVDGGETFTKPVPLSPVNSCVNTPKNGWSATRWAMGGDYFGFAAAPDGTFRAVWADSRSSVYQLRSPRHRARGLLISF